MNSFTDQRFVPSRFFLPALLLVALGGNLFAQHPTAPFRPKKLAEMDAAINEAIANKNCPGGVLWLEHNGATYHKAFGNRAVVPAVEAMSEDTIFDAASLTKVVACTPAVMLLVERGRIGLDDKVTKFIPEFAAEGKGNITVRQLLTHTSGLRPDVAAANAERSCQKYILPIAADVKIGIAVWHVIKIAANDGWVLAFVQCIPYYISLLASFNVCQFHFLNDTFRSRKCFFTSVFYFFHVVIVTRFEPKRLQVCGKNPDGLTVSFDVCKNEAALLLSGKSNFSAVYNWVF